jgi:uncharacterized protein DUF6182
VSLSQQVLRAEVTRRIGIARPDLAARFDLSSLDGMRAAQREAAEAATSVVTVLHRLDLGGWIRGTCAFAMGLTGGDAAAWRRSFTRTVFLAGNPENLRDRFAFAHVAEDGTAAWAGPGGEDATAPLRRLLRLLEAPQGLPAWPKTVVRVPGTAAAPVHRDLYLMTAGATVAGSLVSLNHLLAEAVMDGLIRAGARLTVCPVPTLAGVPVSFAALRVGPDPVRPDLLRAYAGLTEVTAHE